MVGNDVVDLADRDSRPGTRHRRFDERVFTRAERRLLARTPDATALRWMLWSAKESAYKAARQGQPDTVFSPRRFEVAIDETGRGRVHHGDQRYSVRVERHGDCVHAVSTPIRPRSSLPLFGVARLTEPANAGERASAPGRAARRLALGEIARRLGLSDELLCLDRRDRIPRIWHRDGRPAGWLSLSHHGRFVAFAWKAHVGPEALP